MMAVVQVEKLIEHLDKLERGARQDSEAARARGDKDVSDYYDGKAAAWSELARKVKEGLD